MIVDRGQVCVEIKINVPCTGLFYDGSFVFQWGHIGKTLETRREILRGIEMQQFRNLRKIIFAFTDQCFRFVNFQLVITMDDPSRTGVRREEIFYGAFAFSQRFRDVRNGDFSIDVLL